MEFEKFKKVFDESFGKVTPKEFIQQMENLGYKFKEVSVYLDENHICFDKGHNMFLVTEIDNGRSKYGDHQCSRCGYTEPFQYDYN